MSNIIDIDAQAEREGLAELRAAELGLTEYHVPGHVLLGMQAAEAEERGLPKPSPARYCWQRSCEAHARLSTAPWSRIVWGVPDSKKLPSTNDRERRARKYLHRARCLLQLHNRPGSETIDLPRASLLTGLGLRTLTRAAAEGRLPALRSYEHNPGKGRFTVRIADLRDHLQRKLSGPMQRRKPARKLTAA